jgi:hypothetical protein
MLIRLHNALALSVENDPMARILSHRPCGAEKGSFSAAIGHVSGDEILRNTQANNAFENFEIAADGGAARVVPLPPVSRSSAHRLSSRCRREERMAEWVDANERGTLEIVRHEERQAA